MTALMVLWLHLLAAMVWIGGMLFLALVLMPSLRGLEDPKLRSQLVHVVGRRFRTVGWIAIGVLIVTGILNVMRLGVSPIALLDTRFGAILGLKLTLVSVMLILSGVHDFILGPKLTSSNPTPGSTESEGLRRTVVMLARVNLLIGIIIVLLGLMLSHG